jgi:NADH-quinone oxidoreductase subunit H
MMWVRWTLPRLRIDQVMMTCLKYLLPLSCFLLLGVSVWQVFVPPAAGALVKYVAAGATLLLVVWTAFKLVTTPSKLPTPGVPAWGARYDLAKKA